MTITTDDVRKFATNSKMRTFANLFDEWLESHDAEVRMDAIIARDTRTPDELLQAAWEAAYPVPEGRVIPADIGVLRKGGRMITYYEPGVIQGNPVHEPGEFRTLAPLPPLIPEGTPAVWASTEDCDVRRVLVLSEEPIGDMLRYWRDGDGDEYRDEQLIDPVPIPKEGD